MLKNRYKQLQANYQFFLVLITEHYFWEGYSPCLSSTVLNLRLPF